MPGAVNDMFNALVMLCTEIRRLSHTVDLTHHMLCKACVAANRLGMLWMYEASFLFHSIWKVVSPFIDAATKAKIKFIGRESVAELQSVIGPAVSLVRLLMHLGHHRYALDC